MQNNTFGEFLANRRKLKGLTQKDLAEKLYVSESTVGKWEQNRANPDITLISTISQILEVSEHELITASLDDNQKVYSFPQIIKKHCALFCIILNSILLFIMLIVINTYTNGNWIIDFALPLTGLSLTIALFTTVISRYLKTNKLLKTGIILAFIALIFTPSQILINLLVKNAFDVTPPTTFVPNLSSWTGDFINNNVSFVICSTLLLLAVSFIIFGKIKKKNKYRLQ